MVLCGVAQKGFPARWLRQRQGANCWLVPSGPFPGPGNLSTEACPFPSGSSGSDYPSILLSFLKPFICSFIHSSIHSLCILLVEDFHPSTSIFSPIPQAPEEGCFHRGLCAQYGNHPLNKTLSTILNSFLPSRRSELFG